MSTEPEKTRLLTVRIPVDQHRAVERMAKLGDRSMSAIVRLALTDWLRTNSLPKQNPNKEPRP